MSRGFWDTVIGLFGRSPMRCRQCQRRFYKRRPHKDEETEHHSLKESDHS